MGRRIRLLVGLVVVAVCVGAPAWSDPRGRDIGIATVADDATWTGDRAALADNSNIYRIWAYTVSNRDSNAVVLFLKCGSTRFTASLTIAPFDEFRVSSSAGVPLYEQCTGAININNSASRNVSYDITYTLFTGNNDCDFEFAGVPEPGGGADCTTDTVQAEVEDPLPVEVTNDPLDVECLDGCAGGDVEVDNSGVEERLALGFGLLLFLTTGLLVRSFPRKKLPL